MREIIKENNVKPAISKPTHYKCNYNCLSLCYFVKKYYTPEKIKEKQKALAEIAALAALKYWINRQKITQAVEHKTTKWKRRLA